MKLTNALMVVAVLAVVVSAVNLFNNIALSASGRASSTPGNVSLEIQQLIDINFTRNNITWGAGYVNTSNSPFCSTYPTAILDTNNSADPILCGVGWNSVTQGLILQSDATLPIKINLTSSQDASTFFGYTPPITSNFSWKVSEFNINNVFEDACDNTVGNLQPTSYTEIAANTSITICNKTYFAADQDELKIDFQVNLSKDAPPAVGYKSAIITATAWL